MKRFIGRHALVCNKIAENDCRGPALATIAMHINTPMLSLPIDGTDHLPHELDTLELIFQPHS